MFQFANFCIVLHVVVDIYFFCGVENHVFNSNILETTDRCNLTFAQEKLEKNFLRYLYFSSHQRHTNVALGTPEMPIFNISNTKIK